MVVPAANGLRFYLNIFSTGKSPILASTMGSSDDFRGMLDLVTKHQIKPIVWKEIEATRVAKLSRQWRRIASLVKLWWGCPTNARKRKESERHPQRRTPSTPTKIVAACHSPP